jgi:hypothetical protein
MSELNGQAPSDKAQGSEGIKSSRPNPNLDHRQDLEKSYYLCTNDLQEWFIANGYYKLLQINPEQIYKEQVAYAIRRNNSFNLPLTEEIIFKSIWSAHTKTKKTIENLYFAFEDKSRRGDL